MTQEHRELEERLAKAKGWFIDPHSPLKKYPWKAPNGDRRKRVPPYTSPMFGLGLIFRGLIPMVVAKGYCCSILVQQEGDGLVVCYVTLTSRESEAELFTDNLAEIPLLLCQLLDEVLKEG